MDRTIVEEFESKAELQASLNRHRGLKVIVGEDAEAPRRFYMATAENEPNFVVGVISSGHGPKPSLTRVADTVMLGHDCRVTGLDFQTLQTLFVITLNGVFFEFICFENDSRIVIHELGAIKIDARGNSRWSVDTDVVAHFELDKTGLLRLRTLDGKLKIVDPNSGAVNH